MIKFHCSSGLLFLLVIFSYTVNPAFSQQTPEQYYFEWTDLEFSKETYQLRRDSLVQQLKRSGGGIFITPSRDGLSRGETFRQLNDFMYFTGLELPNSILIVDSDSNHTVIFGPNRDQRFESTSRKNDFPGRPLIDDPELRTASGIEDMRSMDQLDGCLDKLISGNRLIRVNHGHSGDMRPVRTSFTTNLSQEQQMILHLNQSFNDIKLSNAYEQIAILRMIKGEEELENIKKAIQITVSAITRAAKFISDGVYERQLEAELEAEFKRLGSPRMGFSSIIKSGPNSIWPWRILAAHYDRRNRIMRDGELVIFDVGCEYNYYTSDIGRTFPVSGQFNKEQREALEMQISVSDAVIAAIKPGKTFSDLKKVAESVIPPDQLKYMQVGSFYGHHIGMSSGDPALVDAKLKPGMVFTVEPWYYNHEKGISVFTEDIVVVTVNGAEVLTSALPRSPDELEKMVAANKD